MVNFETVAEEETIENKDVQDSIKKNSGNGANLDQYEWTQTLQEVEIRVPIPKGTKSKFLNVAITKKRIKFGLKNETPIVDDELWRDITDSIWTIEDGSEIVIVLEKKNTMEWWAAIGKNEPKIDTKAVEPENSNLSDLDPETRKTVEKMMFDQQQKQLGKPTSEELEKQKMIQEMIKKNPELADQLKGA